MRQAEFNHFPRLLPKLTENRKRRALTNFHSFRRWFITKCERADVKEPLIAAIVGHKRSGITLGRYSEGSEVRAASALF